MILALKLDDYSKQKQAQDDSSKLKRLALLEKVSPHKRQRIARLRHTIDQERSIYGEMLVVYGLNRYFGLSRHQIQFKTTEAGKPFLEDSDYHFSISHSGEWVVCAINRHPIGVDIEEIKDIDINLCHTIYTLQEQRYVYQGETPQDRLQRFYRIWTMKESYVKAVGLGVGLDFKSFGVPFEPTQNQIISEDSMAIWHVMDTCFHDKYHLSLCASDSKPTILVEYVTKAEICDHFQIV